MKLTRNLALLTTATLLGTMAAHAYGPSASKSFYLGIHGGISHNTNKFQNTLNITTPGVEQNTTLKGSKNTTSGLGEITAGIQYFDHTWMSGLELAANMDGHSAKKTFNNLNNADLEAKIKKTFGIVPALVAGRTFHGMKTILIVKLGMSINRYKLSAQDIRTGKKESGNKTKLGFAPSIAVEQPFTKNISGVATLGYEWNGKVKKTLGSPMTGTSGNNTLRINTNAYVGKLGIQFKF